ncbi:MAG TPA: UbiD family decarboxylase, partial [Planctomycetota bacterium]|nr:UbiD family decarboxylase [Planctomycetota bacterium]
MPYRSLRDCVLDLERHGQLVRVREEVDPDLEIAEIQRRAYAAGAPALLFESVRGTSFPVVGNLFGTLERCRFIFRRTLERVRRIVAIRADPSNAWRAPGTLIRAPWTLWSSLPRRTLGRAPAMAHETTIDALPRIRSWPEDGGPFITLPQVYTEDPDRPGIFRSNLGMYRIQLAGNQYGANEIGLHYQIHRGIGAHHAAALRRGEPLRVSIFIGGPPSHTLAAVMPLPESISELLFAGMLAGRRFRYKRHDGYLVSSDADFVITGTVDPRETRPEGPFGDHLGYYSLVHDFPFLRVEKVWHRRDAIWPFTVVGRPPQEDTSFGKLIHEITAPVVPKEIPGVHALHAVDAAGVHPLLLAIGSERYVPWGERIPQELLTIANAILGFGQCSLAKYLLIAAREDDANLDVEDVGRFIEHVLER